MGKAGKYLRLLLWLIALHSFTAGCLLILLGNNGISYFGFPEGNQFFQVQAMIVVRVSKRAGSGHCHGTRRKNVREQHRGGGDKFCRLVGRAWSWAPRNATTAKRQSSRTVPGQRHPLQTPVRFTSAGHVRATSGSGGYPHPIKIRC